jgi:hypothetical protein
LFRHGRNVRDGIANPVPLRGTCRLGWSFSGNPAWVAMNAGFINPAYFGAANGIISVRSKL